MKDWKLGAVSTAIGILLGLFAGGLFDSKPDPKPYHLVTMSVNGNDFEMIPSATEKLTHIFIPLKENDVELHHVSIVVTQAGRMSFRAWGVNQYVAPIKEVYINGDQWEVIRQQTWLEKDLQTTPADTAF